MINRMKSEFEVIVLNANVYVEFHIHWDHTQQKLCINQTLYVSQILKWFWFEHVTHVNTPIDPNVHHEHSLVVGPFPIHKQWDVSCVHMLSIMLQS
jgi:hypothetical protein